MRTVRTTEVGPRLPELLRSVGAGDEVLITRDDEPVAKLTSPEEVTSLRDLRPSSVGAVLRSLSADDLLEEMLDR